MKLKIFLLSVFFCFFAFTASSFALTNSQLASLVNASSVSSTYKANLVANISAGKYITNTSTTTFLIAVPQNDVTSYVNVTYSTDSVSGYPHFYSGSTQISPVILLNLTGYPDAPVFTSMSSNIGGMKNYYSDSILNTDSGSTNMGGLTSFLAVAPPVGEAPQQADLQQLIAAPSGNLMNHFGVTSTTLLAVGITIFCLLLLVPLIPRLVRSFL